MVDKKTIKYQETVYLEGACFSAQEKGTENWTIEKADPKLIQKNEKTVNLE